MWKMTFVIDLWGTYIWSNIVDARRPLLPVPYVTKFRTVFRVPGVTEWVHMFHSVDSL